MAQVFTKELFFTRNSLSLSTNWREYIYTEIAFVCQFCPSYLLYLKKDLSSLKILSRLFPFVNFHAYACKEESFGNLIYHKEEFNDELMQGWRNSSEIVSLALICEDRRVDFCPQLTLEGEVKEECYLYERHSPHLLPFAQAYKMCVARTYVCKMEGQKDLSFSTALDMIADL